MKKNKKVTQSTNQVPNPNDNNNANNIQVKQTLVHAQTAEHKIQLTLKSGSFTKMMKKSNLKKADKNVKKQNQKCCHQCGQKGRDRKIECDKCRFNSFCISCMPKWYPNVSEEEFVKACPVCRNNCNCKACLQGFSPAIMHGYSCSEPDKMCYSKHIIDKVFPLVKRLNDEQQLEKTIEAKIKGISLSELQLQQAECEVDDDIVCDYCGAYFFDFYRSCACGYDLCLACSRDLRDCRLQSTPCIDGTISCPPKDIGGCDNGTLELKSIMPVNYVVNMLEKAKKIYEINRSEDIPETSTTCCMYTDACEEVVNENSDASYLHFPRAKDIQAQDLKHFQFHWSKGEPIIVSDVLSTSSGLSWEPKVLSRAFHDITKTGKRSRTCEVNTIDCFNWSEVTVDLDRFFRGYSEGGFEWYGRPRILKLENWQPCCFSQGEWPRHFVEFIRCLPFNDYTHPHYGYLNAAINVPDLPLNPDMGPRMNIAYGVAEELQLGDSVTKLHYDKSDTVNVLTHTQSAFRISSMLKKAKMGKRKHDDQDEASLVNNDGLTTTKDQQHPEDPMEEGALWDIFQRQDIAKLKIYLENHSADLNHANCPSVEQVFDPIHDQNFYLSMEHKRKLKEEFGIEPWTLKQKLGDAVFIPAGCPYQVRNLKSCTKVELNFLSPESLGECILLHNELCTLPKNHRAKQQKLNIGKMMMCALDRAVEDFSSNKPINDLQFAMGPEILNGDDCKHTNGWIYENESDETNSDGVNADELLNELICISNSDNMSSPSQDGSPILQTTDHVVDQEPATLEDADQTLGLYRGHAVGVAAKQLLQAVEHHHPNTFEWDRINSRTFWLPMLKEFHRVIKRFLETSREKLTQDLIITLREELSVLGAIGFDLSWAHKRLDMVQKHRFGNDPLRQKLLVEEESFDTLKEKLIEVNKQLAEVHQMVEKVQEEFNSAKDARDNTARELARKYEDKYVLILNGQLGVGLLPGYY